MKKIYYLILFIGLSLGMKSQSYPFLEEMYDISVDTGFTYGVNATILYLPWVGEAIPTALKYDLYQPVNDGDARYSLRPLIIYFHSGNFLPFPDNLSPVGTRHDSSAVEMCRKLARSGFVVASADYRLGWNPIAEQEIGRVTGLINAAYRGVQDANTCIRHFKKTVVEDGNPFRIDTSRIILFGDDSGGYISLNTGCLDRYDKIPTASNGKFLIPTPFGLVPMVIEAINGDVEGKNIGVMPNDPLFMAVFPYPVGDTLCYSNYPQYSSDFAASVNLAGGVGDTAWIDPDQPCVISVHAPYDQTTPYKEDWLYVDVPPAPLRVVILQGSYLVSSLENQYGNNTYLDPPNNITDLQFAVTDVADERNDGISGLFPILGDTISDGTPWVFWDSTNVNNDNGLKKNPHMSREKGETYMDSILAYVLPRLFRCTRLWELTSTQELLQETDIDITMYPNPSSQEIFIATKPEYIIQEISVYDMKGSLVDFRTGININSYNFPIDKLLPGQYILKFQFDQGVAARQIVVQ